MTQQEQIELLGDIRWAIRIGATSAAFDMIDAALALLESQAPAEQHSPERTPCECRKALEMIQWGNAEFDPHSGENGTQYDLCPLCDQSEVRGHSPDCLVGAALSAPCSGVPVSEALNERIAEERIAVLLDAANIAAEYKTNSGAAIRGRLRGIAEAIGQVPANTPHRCEVTDAPPKRKRRKKEKRPMVCHPWPPGHGPGDSQ